MSLSKDDAARAMGDIESAGGRMMVRRIYAYASPHMIVWGIAWLVGNCGMDLLPRYPWLMSAAVAVGCAASAIIGWRQGRKLTMPRPAPPGQPAAWRFAANFVLFTAFCTASLYVLGPFTGRQGNAFLSLFWAFMYMVCGVWTGWRLFVIGAVTAALILYGYVNVTEHYSLWMGLVAGGSLILGGLWLRKA